MLNRKDFVSSRNYFLISILHYCLKPLYFLIRIFSSKKITGHTILFIELGHMGDMLTTASVIKLVKEQRQDSYIVCLCSPSAALALNNNPFVNEIRIMDSPVWYKKTRKETDKSFICSFGYYLKLLKEIKADTIVNVRATSYQIDHIAVWLSAASERVGFGNKGLDYLLTYSGNAPANMPLPLQKLNLVADWLGLTISRERLDPIFFSGNDAGLDAEIILNELNLRKGNFIVGINPGAQHNFLWPEKHFIQLCILLKEAFSVEILFIGTAIQEPMIKRMQQALPFKTYSAAGKTNLDELFELLKFMRLLITVDTGIRHMANAANLPVVAIRFGADGYERYGKYAIKETVIFHRVICAPCGLEVCPLPEMICMTLIKPIQVFELAADVLRNLAI